MPGPADQDTSDYSDDFAANIAGEISESLFSSGKSTPSDDGLGDGETVNEEVAASAPPAPPQQEVKPPEAAITPGQNSVGKPLPKSWKKDVSPLWEKADPALHEYIYAREADMMRGIQQYAQGHQQWDALIKPFAPIFQQNPEVQPVQIMQGLMNTHLQLLNPSLDPQKKLEMAKAIMSEYGIEFGDQQPHAQNPRVAQLEARLAQMEAQSRSSQQQAYAAGVAEQQRAVDTFVKDPKNKYFSEVQNDILRFIQSGAATDLPSAYDLACWANPAVRAKILAEQQASAPVPPPPARKPNGQFVNLDSGDPKPARTRKGSIDDTINAVIATNYPKH